MDWQSKKKELIQQRRAESDRHRTWRYLGLCLALIMLVSTLIPVFAQTGSDSVPETGSAVQSGNIGEDGAVVVSGSTGSTGETPEGTVADPVVEEPTAEEQVVPQTPQDADDSPESDEPAADTAVGTLCIDAALFDGQSSVALTVLVDGAAYADRAYRLIDTGTAAELGERTTDGSGSLTLFHLQQAVFNGIPAGSTVLVSANAQDGAEFVLPQSYGAHDALQTVTANGALRAEGTVPANDTLHVSIISAAAVTPEEADASTGTDVSTETARESAAGSPAENADGTEDDGGIAPLDLEPQDGPADPYSIQLQWLLNECVQLPDPDNSTNTYLSMDYASSLGTSFDGGTANYINTRTTLVSQLTFSNSIDYEIGEVVIRMPATLLSYRDGTTADMENTALPLAPNMITSSHFNYTLSGDGSEYIITNCKKILAGSNNLMQFSYQPYFFNVADESSFSTKAQLIIGGEDMGYTNEITGDVDTAYRTGLFQKTVGLTYQSGANGDNVVPLSVDQMGYTNETKPADFDDYWYIPFTVHYNTVRLYSQPYTIKLEDTPGTGGEVVQAKVNYDKNLISYTPEEIAQGIVHVLKPASPDDHIAYNNSASSRQAGITYIVRYPKATYNAGDTVSNHVKLTFNNPENNNEIVGEVDVTAVILVYNPVIPLGTERLYKSFLGQKKIKLVGAMSYGTPLEYHFDITREGYIYTGPVADAPAPEDSNTTLIIEDDDLKMRYNPGEYVILGAGDYTFAKLTLKASAIRPYVNYNAQSVYNYVSELTNPIKLLVKTAAHPDTWQEAASIPPTEFYYLSETLTLDGRLTVISSGDVDIMPFISDAIVAEGIIGVRAEMTENYSTGYMLSMNLGGEVVLNVESEVVRPLLQQAIDGSSDSLELNNTCWTDKVIGESHTPGEYSALAYIFEPRFSSEFVKTSTAAADTANSRVTVKNSLRYGECYSGYFAPTVEEILDSGVTNFVELGFTRSEYAVYDLLPYGHILDPDTTPRATVYYNTSGDDYVPLFNSVEIVSTEATENYRGSGRTMLKFTVRANYKALDVLKYDYRPFAGFMLHFDTYYSYSTYDQSNATYNVAAIQALNGGLIPVERANFMKDYVPGLGEQDLRLSIFYDTGMEWAEEDAEGVNLLYDVNNDGITNQFDTKYAEAYTYQTVLVATATGIIKSVRNDEDVFGVYTDEASVATGGGYTYRLLAQNTDGGTMKDVVIYDRLERAAIDRNGQESTAFDDTFWQGTFAGVDTSAVEVVGIAPVIYYSTVADAEYDLGSTTAGWTTIKPANNADIKAVAVDLSKKTDSTDYIFEPLEGLYVDVKMTAPATLTEGTVHAYNNPAWSNTFIPAVGEPENNTTVSNSVSVTLYEPAELEVEKTTVGVGTDNVSFTFVLKLDGVAAKRVKYQLWEKDAGGTYVQKVGLRSTNGNGEFSLTHNQKAVFLDLKNGAAYEVTEASKEGNTVIPEGGVISGTLDADARANASFENTYGGNQYTLTLEKALSVPQTITGYEDTRFEFQVKQGETNQAIGELTNFANKEYKLYRRSTITWNYEEITEGGPFFTDAEGKLTLADRERAEFTDKFLAGTHIYIVETPVEGFSVRNNSNNNPQSNAYNDILNGNLAAYFTNTYTPQDTLTVSKSVEGEGADPEDTFTFQIVYLGYKLSYKGYYLYEDGVEKKDQVYRTDGDGQFTLKDNQTAVFEDLYVRGAYTVTEVDSGDYRPEQATITGTVEKGGSTAAFVNTKAQLANLTVAKTVVGDTAPSTDAFTFTVNVGDAAYANKEYKLYESGTLQTGTYSTDADGKLTLKNDQTAVFEGIEVGMVYEVTEDTATDYTAAATGDTGTVAADTGSTATFTNTYAPKRSLSITKTVVGDTAPATDTFTFTVNVGGAAYANKEYKLYENGALQTGTYSTDADGKLTLKHGQTATFESIDVGTAYTVTEDTATDYTTASEGAAGTIAEGNSTAAFTNTYDPRRSISFSKTVTNADGFTAPVADEFTFAVQINGQAYADQAYKLYNVSDPESPVLIQGAQSTDEEGKLTIKANQQAVFEDLPVGTTAYIVTEDAKDNYTLQSPASGSLQGTLTLDGVSQEFNNYYLPVQGLAVAKVVAGTGAPEDDAFTFTVKVGGAVYANKAYDLYVNGEKQTTAQSTGNEGTLTLKHNEQAVFEGIAVGSAYEVTEAAKEHYEQGMTVMTGTIAEDTRSQATFTNTYVPKTTLNVTKAVEGENAPADAEFTFTVKIGGELYANKSYAYTDAQGTGTKTTNGQGQFTMTAGETASFADLPAGTAYEIVETENPDYTLTTVNGSGNMLGTAGSTVTAAFTNTYAPKRDLAVTKQVTAGEAYPAPAISTFEYTINVNGGVYRYQVYDLYDISDPANPTKIPSQQSTDANGKFRLARDQKAVFTGIDVGATYTVTETSIEDYRQTSPDGAATGTLGLTGATAAFVNAYEPEQSLSITKTVTGSDAPAADTFTFVVKVDDAVWANKPYTLYRNGEAQPGAHTTDAAGTLSLQGGDRVVLNDVPVGSSYEVTEQAKDDYIQGAATVTGTMELTGAVVAYTNAYTPLRSLTVNKTVTGENAPADESFRFTLYVEGIPAVNMPYTLYTDGVQETGATHSTDDSGVFQLQANQSAVFASLPLGASYTVTEEENADYELTATGAEGTVAADNSSTASFVNAYEPKRDLKITKTVVNGEGFTAPADDVFTFAVQINGRAYAYQVYSLYDVSDPANPVQIPGTPATDAKGQFTLLADRQAVFTGLSADNTVYAVTESGTDGYTQTEPTTPVQGTLGLDGVDVTFTNRYEPWEGLTIRKTVVGNGAPAADAFEFTVQIAGTAYANEAYTLWEDGVQVAGDYTTDAEGKLTLMHSQEARFTHITVNSQYEVTEAAKADYEQESSVINGAISASGSSAVFTNTYSPKRTLTVEKVVTGTDAPADAEFTFTATIGGEVYAEQEYTLYEDPEDAVGTQLTTGTDGTFVLKAGQKAVFDGILQGTAYEITETEADDYTVTKANDRGNVNGDRTTATFTNDYAPVRNIEVTKQVTKSLGITAPEGDTFTFTLTVGGEGYSYQAYDLYDVSDPTDPEKIPTIQGTNKLGQFTLQENQKAVFAGLPVGTAYAVTETPKLNYVQTAPADAVTGTVTTDGASHTFVNDYQPKTNLTVSKAVVGEGAPDTDVFTFTVTVDDAVYAGKEYKLYRNGQQVIGLYETDAAGQLTLKAGEQAVFADVQEGSTYRVEESALADYTQADASLEGAVAAAGAEASFVNTYTPGRNLTVEKTVEGEQTPSGMSFTFTVTVDGAVYANQAYTLYENGVQVAGSYSTDAAGRLTLQDGQKAVFEGISAGADYAVAETPTADYVTDVTGGTGTIQMDNSSTASFVNTYDPRRSIEVTKTVTAADGFTPAADDVFTFVITINGELYRFKSYRLFDQSNTELSAAQATDANGRFTLQAGWRAVFEGLSANATVYEISELGADGYVQTSPDGSATGTLGMDNVTVAFENRYEPWEGLTVRKTVAGQNAPAGEDRDAFTFTVTVGGAAYANKAYRLYENGVQVSGDYTTDAAGQLTLKGDQEARFDKITQGTAYTVAEAAQEGYEQRTETLTGEIGEHGSVAAFVNTYTPKANLTVTKQVQGTGAPEADSFSFTVKLNGAVYANAAYTLYINDEEQTDARYTDANGRFTLQHNEKAVFEGIGVNTFYEVTEAPFTDYTRMTESFSGNMSAEGATAGFVNDYAPTRDIAVEKAVTAEAGFIAPETDTFSFRMTVDGANYQYRSYQLYDVSDPADPVLIPSVQSTDKNGRFTLSDGQRAVFSGIVPGTEYVISEAEQKYYTLTGVTGDAAGTMTTDNVLAVFTNHYAPKEDLRVKKTVTGSDVPADTEFTFLVRVNGAPYAEQAFTLYENGTEVAGTYATDATGNLTLKANQEAVFEDILLNTPFQVTESGLDDFTQTMPGGDGIVSGTVQTGSTAAFINAYTPKTAAVTAVKTSDAMVGGDPTVQGRLVAPGDRITYYVKVINSGDGEAKNITVRDYIPAGTTYVDGSASNDGSMETVQGKACVNWNIASLQPDAEITVHFTVTVNALDPADTPVSIDNAALYDNGNKRPKNPGDPTDPESSTNELTNPTVYYEKYSSPAGGLDGDAPGIVREGDILTYYINVTAPVGGAKGIVVSDPVPEGVTLLADSIQYRHGNGAWQTMDEADAYKDGVITWPAMDIAAGVTGFRFRVLVNPLSEGVTELVITNAALLKQAIPGEKDKNYPPTPNISHKVVSRRATVDKTAAVIVDAVPQAEDRGTQAAPVPVQVRQQVEYRLAVTGTGTDGLKSKDIQVLDPLPEGCELVVGSIAGEIRNPVANTTAAVTFADLTADGVKWVINGLDNGEIAYLTFRVYAPESADDGTGTQERVFVNQASMTDKELEARTLTESITTVDEDGTRIEYMRGESVFLETVYRLDTPETFHKVQQANVTMVKTAEPAPSVAGQIPVVAVGDMITYKLTLTNTGAVAAEKVRVADLIPAGTSFVDDATFTGVYTEAQNRVDWVVDEVMPGADNSVELSFRVRVEEPAAGSGHSALIVNTGYVYVPVPNDPNPPVDPDDPTPPLDPNDPGPYIPTEEVQHQLGTFVKTSDPVGGTDADSAALVREGQAITYTLQFVAGDEVTDLTVTDAIPDGLVFVPGSGSIVAANGFVTSVDDAIYDSATHTVTFRVAKVQAGVTGFRFKVVVDRIDGETEKLFENKATLVFTNGADGEKTIESNVVTHRVRVAGTAAIEKTAALIVSGTAIAEDRGSADNPVETLLGQTVEYRLRVTYTGPVGGRLVVTDAIPDGTTLVGFTGTIQNAAAARVTSMGATEVERPDGQLRSGVRWVITGLSTGETAYLTFRVQAPTAISGTSMLLTNTARLVNEEKLDLVYEESIPGHKKGEPVYADTPADVMDSEITYHLVQKAELGVVKSSTPASGTEVTAGATITYQVTVTNKGPVTATNVVIMDKVPTGTTLVSGSAVCSDSDTTVKTVSIGGKTGLMTVVPTLKEGATATLTFSVTVDQQTQVGTHTLRNRAYAKQLAVGEDPDKPNGNGYTPSNEVIHTYTVKIGYTGVGGEYPKTGVEQTDDGGMTGLLLVGGLGLLLMLMAYLFYRRRQESRIAYAAYLAKQDHEA